jgi:hypothetical protein
VLLGRTFRRQEEIVATISRLDPERSRRWFAALLVAVALYTAIRATASLV